MIKVVPQNVVSKPKQSHSAAASAAGFEYQFDRMLYHLATATPGTLVGIETDDDISIYQNGTTSLEQDKYVVRANKNPYANTSENLWKTLKIWTDLVLQSPSGNFRFLFATNSEIKKTQNSLVWKINDSKKTSDVKECITELQKTRSSKNNLVAGLMKHIQKCDHALLESVIVNAVIAESTKMDDADLIRVLEPPNNIDGLKLLYWLKGWIRSIVMSKWAKGESGIVSRQLYIDAKDRYCETQKRYRKLERPYREIVVSEEYKGNCMSKTFVEQILEIKLTPERVESEEIETAIENYIRFCSENSRLLLEGEITDREWGVFFDELKNRWKTIQNRNLTTNQSTTARDEIGRRTYFETLRPEYKAPLDGQPTTELYLTHGGYHCLADEMSIRWHPDVPLS